MDAIDIKVTFQCQPDKHDKEATVEAGKCTVRVWHWPDLSKPRIFILTPKLFPEYVPELKAILDRAVGIAEAWAAGKKAEGEPK